MNEICEKCGLPKDLCICCEIAKESQKITIKVLNRRFGKHITLISGFDKDANIKELGKILKKKLACGGTTKGDEIELQGKHKEKAKAILMKEGFKEELIDA